MDLNNGFPFPTNLQSLQGLRVLVVDDNIDFCDLITLLLQPYGVEVQTAFSVQQGLEIFVQWQPDVFVSDIALPDEDGYTLIHQLRTNAGERGEVVLAIAVTGYVSEKTRLCALSSGFDLWFTKPLDLDEFVAVLACLAICQQSSYAKHGELSLEKQLSGAFPSKHHHF